MTSARENDQSACFLSDNASGIAPEILSALVEHNSGLARAYGADPATRRLPAAFSEMFEKEVAVFPVLTGTAANALALSAAAAPYSLVLCHEDSHIAMDECGAVEQCGQTRLIRIPGAHGKLTPDTINAALPARKSSGASPPGAISITQPTERGAVYSPDEIRAVKAAARHHGFALHMDGARFANAVAALSCAPADLTWRVGVDILSFGATKNGALAAEAVVVFDPDMADGLADRRKRAGQTLSKMRFLSVQLLAYLEDGLWLKNAEHANQKAARLSALLATMDDVGLETPVRTNQVFATLTPRQIDQLQAHGFTLGRWGGDASGLVRLVCAFDTKDSDVDNFVERLQFSATGRTSPPVP